MTKVIDVSEHNGTIDWQQVKNDGYHAIIRCGYGGDYSNQDDKQWARNIAEAERVGIPHGVYIYSYAKNTDMAKSEAQHVLRLINGRSLQYPVYYDVEENNLSGVAKANSIAFGETIENAGYWAGVYASAYWWQAYLGGLDRFTKWVASWGVSKAPFECDMWQYSSDGRVNGIYGRVDMNECYRDFTSESAGNTNTPVAVDYEALADAVMRGEYGNGAERVQKLGANYETVQNIVNKRLNGNTINFEVLADAVIRGDYGNGATRRRLLGSSYDAVQAIVDKRYAS